MKYMIANVSLLTAIFAAVNALFSIKEGNTSAALGWGVASLASVNTAIAYYTRK